MTTRSFNPEGLEKGIAQFNAGEYFECHETLEALWLEETGEARLFLQGLIHAAVGLYHLRAGNRGGAKSQLQKAVKKLGPYPESTGGIQLGQLRSQLAAILKAVAEGSDPPTFPRIEGSGL